MQARYFSTVALGLVAAAVAVSAAQAGHQDLGTSAAAQLVRSSQAPTGMTQAEARALRLRSEGMNKLYGEQRFVPFVTDFPRPINNSKANLTPAQYHEHEAIQANANLWQNRASIARHNAFNQLHAGVSPDDRAGIRGADPTGLGSVQPDVFERAIAHRAAYVGTAVGVNPDDRAVIRGADPTGLGEPVTIESTAFDWGDFGIGVAASMGMILLLLGLGAGALAARQDRARPATTA